MNDERRRHVRHVDVDAVGEVALEVGGASVVVEARDVGVGGVFVVVDPPPKLHQEVVVSFKGFRLPGQVVRVQRGGLDRGRPVAPGVAVAFHGVDEATLMALARLLTS